MSPLENCSYKVLISWKTLSGFLSCKGLSSFLTLPHCSNLHLDFHCPWSSAGYAWQFTLFNCHILSFSLLDECCRQRNLQSLNACLFCLLMQCFLSLHCGDSCGHPWNHPACMFESISVYNHLSCCVILGYVKDDILLIKVIWSERKGLYCGECAKK